MRDNTDPTVTITSPTSAPTYYTAESTISVGGTAADNHSLQSVSWSRAGGGSGSAAGTTSWTVSAIPLTVGTNEITMTATDAAGNTSTDTITIVRDNTVPTITITSPTTNDLHSTVEASVTLAGSASDNMSVTSVTWARTGGPSGVATGTTAWNTGSIALALGTNQITVTATDAAGNTGTDTITVVRL